MLTWEERVERVKEACSIKNNKQLEERLGLANGYINDLLKGKNKNPGKLAAALMKDLGINPMWFEDETRDIFGKIDFEKLTPPNPPLLSELDKYIKSVVSDDIGRILIRLKTVENVLGIPPLNPKPKATLEESLAALQRRGIKDGFTTKSPTETSSDNEGPLYTADPAPGYGEEEYEKVPYVWDIAAGPPIDIDEDRSETTAVPKRLLKREGRYYAASIRGGSMAEAGIRDGDMVLIRCADAPRDGAIQVVRYKDQSTLKRLHETGKGWELHYEDGSGRVITGDSADYEVQGEFIAVLPLTANLKDSPNP
jgi:SOS-response transcriptional repressor LexA